MHSHLKWYFLSSTRIKTNWLLCSEIPESLMAPTVQRVDTVFYWRSSDVEYWLLCVSPFLTAVEVNERLKKKSIHCKMFLYTAFTLAYLFSWPVEGFYGVWRGVSDNGLIWCALLEMVALSFSIVAMYFYIYIFFYIGIFELCCFSQRFVES